MITKQTKGFGIFTKPGKFFLVFIIFASVSAIALLEEGEPCDKLQWGAEPGFFACQPVTPELEEGEPCDKTQWGEEPGFVACAPPPPPPLEDGEPCDKVQWGDEPGFVACILDEEQ